MMTMTGNIDKEKTPSPSSPHLKMNFHEFWDKLEQFLRGRVSEASETNYTSILRKHFLKIHKILNP